MPLKTQPLGNYALIEIEREYADVSRNDAAESMQFGKLIAYHIDRYHLTASSAVRFDNDYMDSKAKQLQTLAGKTVRWEEYAEGGQTFEEDGKKYALVSWWRLISGEL